MTFCNTTIRLVAAALLLGAAAGCKPGSTGPAEAPEAAPAAPAPALAKTFQPPAPTGTADDPRVADATASGSAAAHSLARINQKLKDVQKAYAEKAAIEGELKDVAERLRPLVAQARSDCDLILRAARDLRAELPSAGKGYAATAALYRERAAGYRDPELRGVMLRMAGEFERHAGDAPRRAALTDAFIADLGQVQDFLAETERCLRDTATALAVFSAARERPDVSAHGRAFKRRIEQFIAVVKDYQEKLFPSPPPLPAGTPPAASAPRLEVKAETQAETQAEAKEEEQVKEETRMEVRAETRHEPPQAPPPAASRSRPVISGGDHRPPPAEYVRDWAHLETLGGWRALAASQKDGVRDRYRKDIGLTLDWCRRAQRRWAALCGPACSQSRKLRTYIVELEDALSLMDHPDHNPTTSQGLLTRVLTALAN